MNLIAFVRRTCAVAGSAILATSLLFPAIARADPSLPATVNTFIGTQDEGNTFPGASAPFGLIQVSPIGSHYAGWRYDDAGWRATVEHWVKAAAPETHSFAQTAVARQGRLDSLPGLSGPSEAAPLVCSFRRVREAPGCHSAPELTANGRSQARANGYGHDPSP